MLGSLTTMPSNEILFVRLKRPNRDAGAVGYTGGDNDGVLWCEFAVSTMATAIQANSLAIGFGMVIDGPESKFNRLERKFAPAGFWIDLGMGVFCGNPIGVVLDKAAEPAIFLYAKWNRILIDL